MLADFLVARLDDSRDPVIALSIVLALTALTHAHRNSRRLDQGSASGPKAAECCSGIGSMGLPVLNYTWPTA